MKKIYKILFALSAIASVSSVVYANTTFTSFVNALPIKPVPASADLFYLNDFAGGLTDKATTFGDIQAALGTGTGFSTTSANYWFVSTSSPLTVSSVIATSSLATSTIANLGGVINPSLDSGSDIGAQTNDQYAIAPSYGVNEAIPAPISGTSWSFTTPISAQTINKPLRLTCAVGGSAINYATNGIALLYTAVTGTSTSFNTGEGGNESGSASGIVNCNLQGTNGTTARNDGGVYFGGSNGAFNGYLDGVNVSGFGVGVSYGPNTSFDTIRNSTINFNGRNIQEPSVGGANCENMRLLDDVIADSNNQAGGATPLKGMWTQVSGNCQWNIALTSFDDNQVYESQFGGTANISTFSNDHFEDPNATTYPMLASDNNDASIINNLIGSDMMNDNTSGQPDQMEVTGNVNMLGFTSQSNNNVTVPVTRIVNALASSTIINWAGLSCMGANISSYVYGNIPCSPFGVGSDYGQPSLYVASSTANGIGVVDIATSTQYGAKNTTPAILNIGLNPASGSASTTINVVTLQYYDEKTAECVYWVNDAWAHNSGPCNN